MELISIEEFYKQTSYTTDEGNIISLLPKDYSKEIGHFNVFNIEEITKQIREKPVMPYNRRAYYKISLIKGRNKAEYADKVIDIEKNALLFASPKIPYHYVPKDANQSGHFCVFTDEFLIKK